MPWQPRQVYDVFAPRAASPAALARPGPNSATVRLSNASQAGLEIIQTLLRGARNVNQIGQWRRHGGTGVRWHRLRRTHARGTPMPRLRSVSLPLRITLLLMSTVVVCAAANAAE